MVDGERMMVGWSDGVTDWLSSVVVRADCWVSLVGRSVVD